MKSIYLLICIFIQFCRLIFNSKICVATGSFCIHVCPNFIFTFPPSLSLLFLPTPPLSSHFQSIMFNYAPFSLFTPLPFYLPLHLSSDQVSFSLYYLLASSSHLYLYLPLPLLLLTSSTPSYLILTLLISLSPPLLPSFSSLLSPSPSFLPTLSSLPSPPSLSSLPSPPFSLLPPSPPSLSSLLPLLPSLSSLLSPPSPLFSLSSPPFSLLPFPPSPPSRYLSRLSNESSRISFENDGGENDRIGGGESRSV